MYFHLQFQIKAQETGTHFYPYDKYSNEKNTDGIIVLNYQQTKAY